MADRKAATEALALLGQSRIASDLIRLAYHANIGVLITGEEEIARYLGHRDGRVTARIYARFSPNYLRCAAEVLNLGVVQMNQGAFRK